jgi:hypothetical protein
MEPATRDSAEPATRLGGLLQRGHHWRLTRRGWGLAVVVLLGGSAIFLRVIHPFLSVTQPVSSDVLVVEGWMADYALKEAVQEFEDGGYSLMYVTGGPMERGAPLAEYRSYAALGAAVARFFGAPSNQVYAVPAAAVRRDRTYAAAVSLRDWLKERDGLPPAFNVVSLGPHARRSRLLFEEAFGDACEVGVISVADANYDAKRWWAYSQGVRNVMGETASYLYARFLFGLSADRERAGKKSGEDSTESSP